MSNRRRKTYETKRVMLARRAYRLALDNTESFEEDNIGAALAYLMGAILNDSWVDVHFGKEDPHVGPLYQIVVAAGDSKLLGYFRDVK